MILLSSQSIMISIINVTSNPLRTRFVKAMQSLTTFPMKKNSGNNTAHLKFHKSNLPMTIDLQ